MGNQEVSQSRPMENALRENAQRMRAIWETVVEGIVTIDDHGIVESLNPSASRIFGYAPEEVIGQNVKMLMPSPFREEHDRYIEHYLKTGDARIIGIGREVTGRRKNGAVFPMELSVSEVQLGDRKLFTGVVRDITERKQAEDALVESEQRLRAILETAVEGIITIDERGDIESLNPSALRIFGYEASDVIGRNVSMLMPSPYQEQHDDYIGNYLRTGEAKIIGVGREVVGRRRDGSLFPMDLSVGEVRLGERRLFTGLVRDISERRELERAAAAATEEERARIARELHDGLGQQLGGLLFMMNGLQRDLHASLSQHADTAALLVAELSTALTQARQLAHQLYTVRSAPEGLVQALEALAERVPADRGVVCRFLGDAKTRLHDEAMANHLYRIAQEALHNALKHSKADRIDIMVTRSPEGLKLSVADNGEGLEAGTPSRGLGLRSMEQRARLVDGSLSVVTRQDGGTEVSCSIPAMFLDAPGGPAI